MREVWAEIRGGIGWGGGEITKKHKFPLLFIEKALFLLVFIKTTFKVVNYI